MILATYILELNFIRSFVLSFLIKLKGIKKKTDILEPIWQTQGKSNGI